MSEKGIIKDENKTKGQLTDELKELRQRIAELELLEIELRQTEETFKKAKKIIKQFLKTCLL